MQKPATVKDVAKLAGVSTATVSRVLSGAANVSGELAERVRKVVWELRYQPNQLARNLRVQETRTVGVIIPDIGSSFHTTVIAGIEEVLLDAGYSMLLGHANNDPARERQILASLRGENVAGLIFASAGKLEEDYRRLAEGGVALVAVSRVPESLEVDSVSMTDRQGAREAVQHLLKLGHRRIALLNGATEVSTGRERLAGFEEAFSAAGVDAPRDLVRQTGWKQVAAYQAMRSLLAMRQPPTAVFCGANLITLGALQAIHESSLQIPKEVAVVGYDDTGWAASLRPALTTVAQPAREAGIRSARLLLEKLDQPDTPVRRVVLETKLVVRGSCGWQWKW